MKKNYIYAYHVTVYISIYCFIAHNVVSYIALQLNSPASNNDKEKAYFFPDWFQTEMTEDLFN